MIKEHRANSRSCGCADRTGHCATKAVTWSWGRRREAGEGAAAGEQKLRRRPRRAPGAPWISSTNRTVEAEYDDQRDYTDGSDELAGTLRSASVPQLHLEPIRLDGRPGHRGERTAAEGEAADDEQADGEGGQPSGRASQPSSATA